MTSLSRPSRLDPEIAARLKRDAAGLFPAIAQQHDTGEVLMLGWMDDEALHRTLTTGRCSRSTRWAARSSVVQPSQRVGASGPVSSSRAQSALRSSRE